MSLKDERKGKHVTHEEFFVRAGELLDMSNETGRTARLSMKRYIERDEVEGNFEFDCGNKALSDVSMMSDFTKVKDGQLNKKSYQLLVRMTVGSRGKKLKCSTLVNADSLDKFWKDYASILKSGMKGLEKKKKKKPAKKM